MNPPYITLFFAGLCALIQVVLTALVIARRIQARVDFLDGGDKTLLRRIRAHGNFAETTPMALLLLALLEIGSSPTLWLWLFGGGLLLGRVLHAIGLLARGARWARISGMLLTLAVLSTQGVSCLWLFVR